MQSSHAYPSYAPDPGSRRLPRAEGSRRLGLVAVALALGVVWIAYRALAPDALYGLRTAWSDLDATIELAPVAGSPSAERLVSLLTKRLRRADIPAEILATDSGRVTIRVAKDNEARARAWAEPQGNLQLLLVAKLKGAYRTAAIDRLQEAKRLGTYDPGELYDLLPNPNGEGEILLQRDLELPGDGIKRVWAEQDEAGRPALGIQLTSSGQTVVYGLTFKGEGSAVAAVLDGELLSLNRLGILLGTTVVLDAGQAAYEPEVLERMITLIETRLPTPMLPLK